MAIIVLVLDFVVVGLMVGSTRTPADAAASAQRDAEHEKEVFNTYGDVSAHPDKYVVLTTKFLDNYRAIKMSGNIKNNSKFLVKNVKVNCQQTADSGAKTEEIDLTIYKSVGPGEQVKFHNVDAGYRDSQSTGMGCDIKGADVSP